MSSKILLIKSLTGQRWPQVILVIICIFLLTIVLLVTDFAVSLQAAPKTEPRHIVVTLPAHPDNQIGAQTLAQQYMTALLKHQYSTMWSLLDPQVQAIWPGETAFATFWQTRFQDYTLQQFALGKPLLLPHWADPETMLEYNSVTELPVSLLLQPKSVPQQSGIPPEDLHPGSLFQNLPFIVEYVPGTGSNGHQTRWHVLDGGPADLEAPILPPLEPVSNTLQVPILMYHHISDVPPENLLDLSLTVTPTNLSQQLDYLKAHNYHTITFNQLFDALYYNGPLPLHPIILTFDDGYNDAYKFAYPILKAHGYSGMFYIITGKVGWQGQMTWSQMREMLANGMQMGSHTVDHVDMGQLVQISTERAQLELQESKAALQKNLNVIIQQFCYPAGEPFRTGTLWQQQEIVTLLTQDGYIGATTDPGRTGTYQNSLATFALLRIRVDGRESLQGFINSLPWM